MIKKLKTKSPVNKIIIRWNKKRNFHDDITLFVSYDKENPRPVRLYDISYYLYRKINKIDERKGGIKEMKI
ncbi:MAG: hypothetical protein KJ674_03315 [Nanoarchaeota archaeon]|nr:hypothetical protein [Nanoarchaeota archaeon]